MLAQLTDPHIRVGADDTGSAAALAAGVRAVLALDVAPDAVVVTGDIADTGAAEEYARAAELLAPLPMPVHVLPGNHDDRDGLSAAFALPATGFPYAVAAGPLRLVACDTTVPGEDSGRVDVDRRRALEAALAAAPEVPTIVALHHPPIHIGIDALDAIGLPAADRAMLAGLLARSAQVHGVIAGHVHRTAAGTLGGTAVTTCASTNLQARLQIGGTTLRFAPDPPAFALHVLVDGELVTHVQPIER
ncbi:MAG TPA: metallophosphoesterase [Solirubrobacteraceae bacterium]